MNEYVEHVNERDFDQQVLKSRTPVLVDFWAQWCGPRRTIAPIVRTTAEQDGDAVRVFKLNVDDSPALAQRYSVQGIPTLILFQGGVEKERVVGVASQEKISRTIDRYIGRDLVSSL